MSKIRIINNTDLSWLRLMVLYKKEISSIRVPIESIVFEPCKMTIWGIDEIILEVTT